MSYATRFLHKYYLRLYPDVAAVYDKDPSRVFEHYRTHGIDEGRSPNPFIFPNYYQRINPDLRAFEGDIRELIKHWFTFGLKEGRRASPFFDPLFYSSNYSDLSEILENQGYEGIYDHWVKIGVLENRRTVGNVGEPLFFGNNNIGILKPTMRKYLLNVEDFGNIVIEKEQGIELFFL